MGAGGIHRNGVVSYAVLCGKCCSAAAGCAAGLLVQMRNIRCFDLMHPPLPPLFDTHYPPDSSGPVWCSLWRWGI